MPMLTQEQVNKFIETIKFNKEKLQSLVGLLEQGYHPEYIYYYRRDEVGIENWNYLNHIVELYKKFVEIEGKKQYTLSQLEKNGMLTEELKDLIRDTKDPHLLDDLLLPIKRKKPNRSIKAVQQGLTELADFIWQQLPVNQPLEVTAESFVNPAKAVSTPEEALVGAVTILSERIEQDYRARKIIKELFWKKGNLVSIPTKTALNQKTQFEPFYNHKEPISKITPIRCLQILRGMRLGFLKVSIEIDDNEAIEELLKIYLKERGSIFEPYIKQSIEEAYKRQLKTVCENRAFDELKEEIERIFIADLREELQKTLMFPPARVEVIISIVPGIEEDWGVCVVDKEGNLLEGTHICPTAPKNEVEKAQETLKQFIDRYQVKHIVIGDGAGVEDAFQFIGELCSQYTSTRIRFVTYEQRYAQSFARIKLAELELPNTDEKIRTAYYLAKCFLDPLKELMRLNPIHLPEGILHREINERKFNSAIHQIIEHCLSSVGVDLNEASVAELRNIAGLRNELAQNIVEYRNTKGKFKNRRDLLDVTGINEHIYNQCIGFLFVKDSEQLLDRTRIHPQWYEAIEKSAQELNIPIPSLFRSFKNARAVVRLIEEKKLLGRYAIRLILRELRNPGKDPRGTFVFPRYTDGIYKVSDIKAGMQTEGIIKKITNTVYVVDIGIPIDAIIQIRNNPSINRTMRNKLRDKKIGDFIKVNIDTVDFDNKRVHLIPYFPQRDDRKKVGGREKGTGTEERGKVFTTGGDKERVTSRSYMHQEDRTKKSEKIEEVKEQKVTKESPLVNTQLAEQLAALKDKIT